MRRFLDTFFLTLLGASVVGLLEGLLLLPGFDAGRNAIEWLYAFVLYGLLALLLSAVASVLALPLRRVVATWLLPSLSVSLVATLVALYWAHQSPRMPAAQSPGGMGASFVIAVGITGLVLSSFLLADRRWGESFAKKRIVVGRLLLLLLAAATATVAWPESTGESREEPRADAPPVIVVLVDTLRRDHLSVFGYQKESSPQLESFARDCLRFDDACSGGSRTVPSVATLFTGVHPSTHGVSTQQHSLNRELASLPELFRRSGYRTAAFVGNGTMRPDMGYARGFDRYVPEPLPRVLARRKTALELVLLRAIHYDRSPTVDALVPQALDWIERADSRPPFLYLHLMEPHSTYSPPAEYARRFLTEMPARDVSRPPRLRDDADAPWRSWEELEEPVRLSAVETAAMEALYDGEILWTDHWLGRLFDRLRTLGLYDGALILFLSDHGEEFGDHQGWFHGRSLYEEMVGMPMLLKLPESAATGVSGLSMDTIDLLPTLCGLSGIQAPGYAQGHDYSAELSGAASERISYFVEEPPHLYALRLGRWKLIERRRASGATVRLFDLLADPRERSDLAADHPDSVEGLREALHHLISSFKAAREHLGAQTGALPSPDTQELLRSLGYVE